MTDNSQSRYSIMEELNNRKIKTKEALAAIERETDEYVYQLEKSIQEAETAIDRRKATYKIAHTDSMREKRVRLKLMQADYERDKVKLESEIDEAEKNYVNDYNVWEKGKHSQITETKANIDRYLKIQTAKMDEKKDVIKEIESGIDSLKEMSKETVKQ